MGKVNELIQRFLGEPARNLMHAMYDDYVEANVRFRSRAGVKTFIIRRQIGKCCDWCKGIVGIYEKGKEPDDVYRRHDNCRCMVTFRNEKGKYVDVWSKKEFQTQKDARISRLREIKTDIISKEHYEGIPRSWKLKEPLSADEALMGTNPNYAKDLAEYLEGTRDDYTNNCVNCVVAYEMRRRGYYDITACSLGECGTLRHDPFSAWIGRDPIPTTGSGFDDIVDFLRKADDGTRIQIDVQFPNSPYKKGPGGHAFVAERIDGEIVFYNPQTGRKMDLVIFEKAKKNGTMFMRIDDLELSDRGVSACKKVKK